MKKSSSKILWARIIIEALIFLIVFIAVDEMTSPAEETRTAVLEAVNKQQLQPAALVEVSSAIQSGKTMTLFLAIIRVLAVLLLCFDFWLLWQSRRAAKTAAGGE